MKIIISPAKKMNQDADSFDCHGLPQLLPQTQRLHQQLCSMSYTDLKRLWCCNDQIATLNYERLQKMDLHRNLTPAVMSYEGIQYRYLAPSVLTDKALAYLEQNLRILSGFYGILRPFDGVTPYRLEMQAKLSVDGCRNLYEFWGDTIAQSYLPRIHKDYDSHQQITLPASPADTVSRRQTDAGYRKSPIIYEDFAPDKQALYP